MYRFGIPFEHIVIPFLKFPKIRLKWICEWTYIWTVEKDIKTWLITATASHVLVSFSTVQIYVLSHICNYSLYLYHLRVYNELTKWAAPSWLVVQLAQHSTRIAEVMGSNLVQTWIFFTLKFHNCFSCVYNFDDQTCLHNKPPFQDRNNFYQSKRVKIFLLLSQSWIFDDCCKRTLTTNIIKFLIMEDIN